MIQCRNKLIPAKGGCVIVNQYKQRVASHIQSIRLSTAINTAHIITRQMRPLSRNPDSDVEVVEDSEPERVQLRNKAARDAELPHTNTLASGMHHRKLNSAGFHTTTAVIEISDSESSTESCGKNAIIYGSASIAVEPVNDQEQGPSTCSIDIKKFAFKPLPTKQQVEPSRTLPPRPPERRRAPKKVHMNLDPFESDIARVSRCVCCSISWTTRKTAVQKMDHIQRCAKKNGYDDETVRILIKNEIASSKEFNIGHCRVPTPHSTSTTLLEDVVQPRSNKRRNVPPNSHLSVGFPLRGVILSRAKDIISGPSPDEASPQPSAGRKLVSDFPLTQDFTASTLSQGPSKTSLFSATGQDDEYFPELHHEAFATMSPRIKQPTLNPTAIDVGKSPARSHKPIGDDFEQKDYRKEVKQADVRRDLLQGTQQKLPVQKVKRGKPKASEKDIHSGIGTSLKKVVTPPKRVLRKVRSSTKITFEKEWETFMKEHIRGDNELNLRIIRYEPVDIGLFLKLAKVYAPSASDATLKTHLRNFLDNQAIHFYEGNVWKR